MAAFLALLGIIMAAYGCTARTRCIYGLLAAAQWWESPLESPGCDGRLIGYMRRRCWTWGRRWCRWLFVWAFPAAGCWFAG